MSNDTEYGGTLYKSLMAAAAAWAIDALPDTDVLDHDDARGSTEIARGIIAEHERVCGDIGEGRRDPAAWRDAGDRYVARNEAA